MDAAARFSLDTGIEVLHETHRARCLHTPWRTFEILCERPETKLVFDMSHWCNVCESLLDDQEETLLGLLPAIRHIHARVGHSQGPQVSDPPEPAESVIEPWLDDSFPDYDHEPVFAQN